MAIRSENLEKVFLSIDLLVSLRSMSSCMNCVFSLLSGRASFIKNEPWFVGKDIAEILGYERPTKAVQDRVDVEDKDEVPIQDSIGRMQKTPKR